VWGLHVPRGENLDITAGNVRTSPRLPEYNAKELSCSSQEVESEEHLRGKLDLWTKADFRDVILGEKLVGDKRGSNTTWEGVVKKVAMTRRKKGSRGEGAQKRRRHDIIVLK